MKNKLFIVEGVPCTGKTSTAEYISKLINENGHKALYFPEGAENHPADYEFHAFIGNEDFKKFSEDEQVALLKSADIMKNGYAISLAGIAGELFDEVIKFKIYDMLEWDKEYPVMLEKWQDFSKEAMDNDSVYVFDCCFLQNPLCETMMRFNMTEEESYNYVHEIYSIIEQLNPVVMYLKNKDMKQRIEDVSKERDKNWLHDVIEYHTSQGYGRAHDYKGFDGYIECLKARQERELSILDKLPIDKLIIEDPFNDWDNTHKKISDYINKKSDDFY